MPRSPDIIEEEASLTKHEKRTLSVFCFNFSRVALRLKFHRSWLIRLSFALVFCRRRRRSK